MWTIPNIQAITNGSTGYDMQAWTDSTDNAILQAAISGAAFVVTGMTVSPSSGLTVAVAAGGYCINGTFYTYAGGTVTATSAGASDRRDLVSIDTSGTLYVTAGTVCGTAGWVRTSSGLPPVKAAVPSNQCGLADLVVTSTTTTIAAINISDRTTIGLGIPGPCCSTSSTVLPLPRPTRSLPWPPV